MRQPLFPGVFFTIVIYLYIILNNFPIFFGTFYFLILPILKLFGSYCLKSLKALNLKDLKHSVQCCNRAYKIKNLFGFYSKISLQCDLVIPPEELKLHVLHSI